MSYPEQVEQRFTTFSANYKLCQMWCPHNQPRTFFKKKTQNIFPIFSTINVHSMLKYDESFWLWFFLARNFLVFFFLNQTIIILKLKFDPSFSFHMPYVCSRETIMLDFSCIQHKCFVSSIVKILWHILSIFACQYIILQHHMITNIVVCNS